MVDSHTSRPVMGLTFDELELNTSPSTWVGLGSPLAACSVYGDLTCSVHIANNLSMVCNCNWGPYARLAFVPDILSSLNKVIIIIIIEFERDNAENHDKACKMLWSSE